MVAQLAVVVLAVLTALYLVALAAIILVIRDIIREGRERRRKRRRGEMEPYTEDEKYDAGSAAANAADTNRSSDSITCQNCGTENDIGFVYCRSCVDRL